MRSEFIGEITGGSSGASEMALSIHRLLLRFVLSAIHIYAWIFVFEYFYYVHASMQEAFLRVTLLYTLCQIFICLLTPYSARFLRLGARRSLIFAASFAAAAFVLLDTAFQGVWPETTISCAIVGFAIMMGVYRALYWIPYEIESEAHGRRAASTSMQLLIALAPLIGGLVVTVFVNGPSLLLSVGAASIALSTVLLLFVKDVYEKYSWGYRETFTHLFDLETYPMVREAYFDGISGAALLFFWPFAIYLTLGRSFDMLGAVLSLTFVVAVLLRSMVRRGLTRARLIDAPTLNTVLAISPWVFRLTVANPVGVFLVDSFFYTTAGRRMNADPFVFEQLADGGTYVDEYTALKEIALGLGRITLCVLVAIVVSYSGISAALIFAMLAAALASVVTLLWSRSM